MTINYDAEHTIYLHRNETGHVIYVGCTQDIEKRTRAHEQRARWWTQVATVEVDSVQPNYDTGIARERSLIQEFEPQFNTRANPAVDRANAEWQALAQRVGVIAAMRLSA